MSTKITDAFPIVKKTDSVSKHYPQKKAKVEVKTNATDQQQKGEHALRRNRAALGKSDVTQSGKHSFTVGKLIFSSRK